MRKHFQMLINKLKSIKNIINALSVMNSQFDLRKPFNILLNSIKLQNASLPLLTSEREGINENSKNYQFLEKSPQIFTPSMRFIQFYRKKNTNLDNSIGLGIVSSCGNKFIEFPINKHFNGDMINFMKLNLEPQQIRKQIENLIVEEVNDDIILLPPIRNPEKIICFTNNYSDNTSVEFKRIEPTFFSKFANSLIGPNGNICAQSFMTKLDFAINLAIIIGKKGRNIHPYNAQDHIFGYTIAQDITSCYWCNDKYSIIKTVDTFCPVGPCIIHKCAIRNPHKLELLCKVNNTLKQAGNTNDMIYSVEDIVCETSKFLTLQPGDIILTGSPIKFCKKHHRLDYLKDGDCIMSEIQYIGKLINTVVKEK